ncbi:MAG: hypothetical protein Fur0044_10520 [Anaerolineae bacterium]
MITRHYYAAEQRITSRVDNDLYYTLSDPAGNAALFVRSDGSEAGRIILDSSGEVVTNTLPVTLTEKLVSNLNLAANLQYTGQRWYDAGLGLHLQPGSFGGVPAGSGPIGMPELTGGHAYIPRVSSTGWNHNLLPDVVGIIKTWADEHYQIQIGQALEHFIPRRYTIPVNYGTALISLSTNKDTLSNPRFIRLLDSFNGRVSWTSSKACSPQYSYKGCARF